MHVVIGGGLLAGGLLIVTLLISLFARSDGRGWLNAELTAMLLTIPPTAMIGLGAAFIFAGLAGDHRPIDLVALLGWLAIGAGLLWQVRRRREALIAKVRAEGAAGPMPLEPPGPKSPAAPVA